MPETENIIATGAEAQIILRDDLLIKRRIPKGYRIKEIDEKLRKLRTRTEARLIEKASKIISVPKIIKADEKTKEIIMEFIEGKKLSEVLDFFPLEKQKEICKIIGKEIGKIHDLNIIHGDLTTSNMILVENNKEGSNECELILNKDINKNIAHTNNHLNNVKESSSFNNNLSNFQVYLIDFGLGFSSRRIEDKAVDLHLFRQALESKHFHHFHELFHSFISSYSPQEKEKILIQLKKVEERGRYRKNAN